MHSQIILRVYEIHFAVLYIKSKKCLTQLKSEIKGKLFDGLNKKKTAPYIKEKIK